MPKKRKKASTISESDLYEPIYQYLIQQGYTVRSEVMHCDITALKDDELVVIELKRSFNASLLIQATQRQKITDSVYVAIPFPKEGIWSKKWKQIQHLLKRLELGLIIVNLNTPKPQVEILFHPLPLARQKRKSQKRAILKEIDGRMADFNKGGSVRQKLVTAYRENAIFIACCLDERGAMSPKQLRAMGTGPKTQPILYNNHYNWFDRIGEGMYDLKPSGKTEIDKYPEIVEHYRKRIMQDKEDSNP